MPIIAVALAVFAVVEIVEVGLAAMTVFEAIAAVGAVTNGVGVVTGNQDLQNVGQAMSIGGGLGMAATKVGVLDWNPTVSEVTGIPTQAQDAAYLSNVRPEAAAEAAAAAASTTTTTTVTGAAPQAILPPDAAGTINATDTSAGAINAAGTMVETPATPATVAPPAYSFEAEIGQTPNVAAAAVMPTPPPVAPVTWFSAAKEYIAPFTEFAKENQMLTYGALQAGGSVVAGLFDPLKPAQIKKLEAEADLLTSQKTLQDQQNLNLAGAMPRAYRKPKVLPLQAPNKPVGLINASTA